MEFDVTVGVPGTQFLTLRVKALSREAAESIALSGEGGELVDELNMPEWDRVDLTGSKATSDKSEGVRTAQRRMAGAKGMRWLMALTGVHEIMAAELDRIGTGPEGTVEARLRTAAESIHQDDLDDLVHSIHSEQAASVNNAGWETQLSCLREYWDNDTTLLEALEELT